MPPFSVIDSNILRAVATALECVRQAEAILGMGSVELLTLLRHHEHDLLRRLAKPLNTIRGCGLLAPFDLLLDLRAEPGAASEALAELVVDGQEAKGDLGTVQRRLLFRCATWDSAS